jgi:Flp pilus assembly pilin Flp
MLTQFFRRLTQQQLHRRAVASLEYGMMVMLVAVAALGAVSSGLHVPAPNVQVASIK